MRLAELPGEPELTYCTNIHAGESWGEIAASLDEHVPRIKAQVAPAEPFGLGLRLSGIAAAELARPEPLARFKDQLARLGAYVFTLNAFPFGPFHGTRVKEQVYEPDWRTSARASFTREAANILSALLPEGGFGSISTVPGGFKPLARDPAAVARVVDNLLQAAAHLVAIERSSGRHIALALEPEPCCFLETVEEALDFFERHLLARPSLAHFAKFAGVSEGEAEPALRRHLGVCYDVCHGAVEYENPVEALERLRRAGIEVPKIQLSAAMRVPRISPALVERLKPFDTGVYLHQVVAREGDRLSRYVDLRDAFAAFHEGEAQGEWRIHCHVPVFLADLGPLGSTQGALIATLRALRTAPLSPHLEVETYTWDVLPEELKTGFKADDVARELSFVLEELRDERRHGPGRAARDAA
ncbi:MAG TPA: metabolite traffic protein EboE [Beijerinckiaceae bacterium]|jgi:sugar phosphate isomerase/epimerase|nr:metabolite traffic protein EboE [Beijerinckiaceae bacterium]